MAHGKRPIPYPIDVASQNPLPRKPYPPSGGTIVLFRSLSLFGWRQFGKVEISFHPRLTVLTGANGTGKTSILSVVRKHFGWRSSFVSTYRDFGGTYTYSQDVWQRSGSVTGQTEFHERPKEDFALVGRVKYTEGKEADVNVTGQQIRSTYELSLTPNFHFAGLYIPSHRPPPLHVAIDQIPTSPQSKTESIASYLNNYIHQSLGHSVSVSPAQLMKSTLIAAATFGYGNQAVAPVRDLKEIFEGFQSVLRKLLPANLGFRKLLVRIPELILETETGEFSIDALSGGISAIVELAWQIFMSSPERSPFVVVIDEPENHLHPEMQRRVLADLLSAFPTVQFIVATHSPFIVGSVPDSHVYVLDYDSDHKVFSTLLDSINKAGTANEILRDALGLDVTVPLWVQSRLEAIVDGFRSEEFDSENLADLRKEMEDIGLGSLVPVTIAKLARERDHSDPAS